MLKLAVIGAGRMGSVHINNIINGKVNNALLVSVCDISSDVLNYYNKNHPNIKTYISYKDMLDSEKLDGVIIATPHYSHEEISIYSLSLNINTLTEKPISVTTLSAKNMIAASKKSNALFCIMYNQRTNRMYKKAKELIENGSLGKIQRVNFIITNWYRSQAYYNQGGWRATYNGEGGGTLINQCIHQLDVLQWIIGMPKEITSFMKTINRKITVENDVSAILHYDNFDCMFQASAHELKGTNRLEIALEKGKIIIEKNKMNYYVHEKSEIEVNNTTTYGYGHTKTKKYKLSYGIIRLLKDTLLGQQVRILNNFSLAIQKKEKLIANGEEGINALTIINAIYLSAWKNEKITLPINDQNYCDLLELKKIEETKK